MIYPILKLVISALIILAVSEVSKRSSFVGGLVASLPLVSVLAMIWLYRETHDAAKVTSLSMSIFWLVLPSLVLFWILSALLKRQVPFYPALGLSILAMLAAYGLMVLVLKKTGINV